jgi:hypothetical protein
VAEGRGHGDGNRALVALKRRPRVELRLPFSYTDPVTHESTDLGLSNRFSMQSARTILLQFSPPLLAWAAGLLLAFGPVFASGFALVPGDLGDARLIHYLLEHGYRWLIRDPNHLDLWSPAFFYPLTNVAAYSDLLLSAVPFYGCWRLLGVAPDTSFQLCLLTLVTLNFASMYLFLTRCLRLSAAPSALGAFLFAFSSPRLIHIVHLQLHIHFYSVLSLYALYRLFEGRTSAGAWPSVRWSFLFWLGIVGQLYGSFYLGWFLGLGLVVCAFWAMLLPAGRACIFSAVRRHGLVFALGGLVAALPLAWMARHYLDAAAAAVSGMYPYKMVGTWLPHPGLWLSRGHECWLSPERALAALGAPPHELWPTGEQALGIGPLTTVLVVLGLVREWRSPVVRVLLLASLTLVVVFTVFWFPDEPDGPGKSLYAWVFPYLPASGAIRVPARIVLLLLIPAAVGLSCALQRWPRPAVALGVLLVCALEQARPIPAYDKYQNRQRIAAVVERVPPGTAVFFVSRRVHEHPWMYCQTHLDAMWAQMVTGVPTINGYSGRDPPDYGYLMLNELELGEPATDLEKSLDHWVRLHGLERRQVVWARIGPPAKGP